MWWKIYFWVSLVLAIIGSLSVFSIPSEITPGLIFEFIVYYIALVGVYSFIFTKQLAATVFWKFFFWLYVLLDVLSAIKAFFPDSPFQELLGYLSSYENVSPELLLISFLFEIPLLIALYKLTKNEYYVESKAKSQLVAAKTAPKWGMMQTALWGYNTVFTFLIFLLSFTATSGSGQETNDTTSGLLLFAPLLIFWLLVVIRYKHYRWNWWRTTLVANSLLYSGIILFGIVTAVQIDTTASEFDIIGILQLFILFISLIVFGRDQFSTTQKKSVTKKEQDKV